MWCKFSASPILFPSLLNRYSVQESSPNSFCQHISLSSLCPTEASATQSGLQVVLERTWDYNMSLYIPWNLGELAMRILLLVIAERLIPDMLWCGNY